MAQQIKVNSSTGNIQIQISRGAIGPSTTANIANTALNLNAASTANVVIGGGVNGYVLSTDGLGVTSWVAQTGGGGSAPGGANTQIQYNDAGTLEGDATFTFNNTTDVVSASHFSGEAGNLSNIQGANVSGAVANATHATISDSANLVAVANVSGIGNIATVNLDGNAANFLDGTGSFGPAGGGGGTYGDSNVVTLLNAFGSNTITTTGLITGDGGGLSNIAGANISGAVANATHATTADSANAVAGANVTGEVSFAAVANSVTLANVSGAGNIASLNIDGNVSNVLRGDGTFSADTTDYSNTNVVSLMNAFGSNTINTTGNVSVGNLVADPSLTVNGVDGNLLVQPGVAFNGRKYSSISRGEFDAGNSTLNQAFITDSYNADGVLSFDTYANTSGGVLAEGGYFNIQNFSPIGNTTTDPVVPSTVTFSAAPTSANLASPQSATHTSMQIGGSGGFTTVVGAEGSDSFSQGAWRQFQYRPRGIEFFRRAGNGEAREGVVANDETSIVFYMASNNGAGSSTWASNPARIAAKVDSTFSGADNAVVPTGLEFSVNTDADATLTHNMYANGDVTFNATGVITGDGGGLSNIASANVSGLGNISTINLDGNAANYLGGTGVWGPVTAVNANFANFAGNVTLSNQPNITQTGNLLTFTTNDGVANTATHQIDPTLITMPVNYTDTKAQEVITLFGDDITPNYFGGQGTTTYLMNDINTGVPGFSPVVTDYAASNGAGGYSQAVRVETGMDFAGVPPSGTNAYAPGRVQYTFAGINSDLNNDATLGEVKLTQSGIGISPRTSTNDSSGIINVFHYGTDIGAPEDANGLDFTRRRGNNASKVDIAAGDYLGNIRWAGRKATGFQGNKARMGGRVSTTWNGTDNNIPTELFFRTQDNVGTSYDVEFKADGQAEFPGNLTLNGSGIFTGDGGGLSNVAGTTTPGGVSGTIQYNNSGTMDGDSRFEFNPTAGSGTQPQIILEGATGPAPGIFNLNNGILNMFTENLSGGYSPMSFSTYNPSGFIEPINYYRARGTRAAPTATAPGDFIKNERFQAYSGSANFATQFAYAGGYTSQVQANDGLGNIATTTIISTALPANGPDTNDKILFDTEYTAFRGNITMNAQYSSATLGRITQTTQTFASLPASPVVGERAMITDSTASGGSVGTVVSVGGGTFVVPVYWDGSNWKMG